MPKRVPIPRDDLYRLYVIERRGTVEIAKIYGCSATTISYRLRQYGIPARPGALQPRGVNTDLLSNLYQEGVPIKEIAQRLGVSTSTVHYYRRKLGLSRRPRTR